jgi:outer membrane protein OmpA-like peptidoglycan-associated protein
MSIVSLRRLLHGGASVVVLAGTAGCASMSRTEQGAVIGAGTGAVLGGVIGDAAGSTAKGAIIGAVVGGTAGALIGREMDKQAEELEGELDADVERVGEGIWITFESGILFAFDSDALQTTARGNLTQLAESLGEYPNSDVVIVGHTDSRGSEQYNQSLSERRARSAANFLVQRGIDVGRIRTMGLGESEPVASNDTDEGRAQNRRVEVAIFASEEYRNAVQQRVGS